MIIDMHMHVDSASVGLDVSPETCVRAMDVAGVDRAAVMTLMDLRGADPSAMELIAEACEQYDDRLFGFIRLHPGHREQAHTFLRTAITELGFRGLKLHPVSTHAHPAGEETIDLIRAAGELGVPTLFHCGDEAFSTPLSIAPAAAACPDSTIILGHMGGYFHVDEAIDVAERYGNIILETSAMPYPHKIREAVARIGADRVVFGSDGPVSSPDLEREKIMVAGLTDEQTRLVLGGNAASLLGVSA
ncbi:MAG TPA: amidohydrolase family protein [Pseudonocardiaceae bacterium]